MGSCLVSSLCLAGGGGSQLKIMKCPELVPLHRANSTHPPPQAMEPCEFHYHVGCSFPSVQGGFRLQLDLNPSHTCWERAVSDFSARICACVLRGKVKAEKKTLISLSGRKRSCVDGISRIHSCNYREQMSREDDGAGAWHQTGMNFYVIDHLHA